MKLNLRVEWIKKWNHKATLDNCRWKSNEQWHVVDIEELKPTDLDKLLALMETDYVSTKGALAVKQKIVNYRKLLQNVTGVKISRLEMLAQAVKLLMLPTEHKWLFAENKDGYLVPWYVYNVEYEAPDLENGRPACTKISMAATKRDSKVTESLNFFTHQLGNTAYELLRQRGYFVETLKIIEEYVKENARYQEICGKLGAQFNATGDAFAMSDYYSRELVSLDRDKQAAQVVMDDASDENERNEREREHITGQFWLEKGEDDGGEAAEKSVVDLPLQPYVKVFDLKRHQFFIVHVGNLKEYVYDSTLIDKLILPPEHKELVSMLVMGADLEMEDIVKGKTGGIIVVCTGPPGTGKTLTAEVFSEQVEHPLYCVQCSQLGTDEEALEKELKIVMDRAARWKAILLIDEADVYVHARGNDIQQNAIVGTFLRVMEHYPGVMFMTSNREVIIDDAIMSRATAWIRYELPSVERARAIWQVLSAQYRVKLAETDIHALVEYEKFVRLSGRSIKNLLKLGNLMAQFKKTPVTVDKIKYVSQFLDLESATPEKRD